MIVSALTKMHFFYLYYYFFAVGLVSLIYSFSKCAEINSDGVKIFYGLFLYRKFILFKWSEIEDVEIKSIKKIYVWQAGARVRAPVKEKYYVDVFRIKLKKQISSDKVSQIMLHDKINIFIKEIFFDNNRTTLIIRNQPEKGFDWLLFEIKSHLPNQDDLVEPKVNIYNKIVDCALLVAWVLQLSFWLLFRAFIFSVPI